MLTAYSDSVSVFLFLGMLAVPQLGPKAVRREAWGWCPLLDPEMGLFGLDWLLLLGEGDTGRRQPVFRSHTA